MNLVVIMSDEHNRNSSGCYGHSFVKTPNIDRLASTGTRFANAYCNSPICVPSRSSFATGKYVHKIGNWDNSFAYTGSPRSWHHMVRSAGSDCVSIGKLHFRGGDDYGFTEELLPLHVVSGVGDLKGTLRRPLATKKGTHAMARAAGPGESDYFLYDRSICDRAVNWIQCRKSHQRPFVLFVSFVMPHFPLIAPQKFYDIYSELDLETLALGLEAPMPDHPILRKMREFMDYDDHFDPESRAVALRAYFGMVSAMDSMVGEVITSIEGNDALDDTQIMYTSDHGDNLGNRGFWGKSLMYDDSVSIPLILSGPGIPSGIVNSTPCSLVDVFPTVLDSMKIGIPSDIDGSTLVGIANSPYDAERIVFSEYHASGSPTGIFMIRRGKWKLIEYVGSEPQLFDMQKDAAELINLAKDTDYNSILDEMRGILFDICDPSVVAERAFADQQRKIDSHGGRENILQGIDITHTPAPI